VTRAPRAAGVAAVAALAGAVALLFGRVPLGYDSYFALVWGRELAHGHAPDLDQPFASTPHPLLNALTTVLSWLPGDADDLLRGAVLLAFGALCVATFALGRELAGWPVGLLAAAVVATRAPMLETAVRGEVDIPAAALLMWATVLAARPARRDGPVLVLLALAGLLRPEAWALAAAYWLWRAGAWDGRRRVRLTALALAGPALWLAADLMTTGDALWSSHQTHRRVRDSGDVTGLRALGRIPRHVASILWVPALAGSIAGLAAAWARDRERVAVPVAALALTVATGGALALAGQTVLLRFFLFPAAVLAVLAAYAALGWAGLEPGDRARGAWRLGGVALLVGFAAFAPKDTSRAGDLRDRFRGDEQLQSRLVGLATGPARAALRACRPVYVQLGGVVPTLAYVDRLDPDRLSVDLASPAREGALVALAPAVPHRDLPYALPRPIAPPAGYRPVAANESWTISAGCT
jgi:hypothetical protein